MSEYFENPSELIFFVPKSQIRWGYKIDNGKQHIILQDNILNFVKKYIDKKYILELKDILMRHQPFIILIDDKKVVELHKEDDTMAEQHNKLKLEIQNACKKTNDTRSSAYNISNDMFKSMLDKFEKF